MKAVHPTKASGEWLNYHHVLRFRTIARLGGVTRAAKALSVSVSTLSLQLGELEEWLGVPLFDRHGRSMSLTDAGRTVLDHAEAIHQSGSELLGLFRKPSPLGRRRTLRIGAVATLSRNLQFNFIEPLLSRSDALLSVSAGSFEDLLSRLRSHQLDVVLSHAPAPPGESPEVFNHILGEVPACLVGSMRKWDESAGFPFHLSGVPLFLPSGNSPLREQFDLLMAEAGVVPEIRAEVDDMALLRLLALSGRGLALTSAIVVEREFHAAGLRQVIPLPGLSVRFHAVTVRRRLADPWVEEVVAGIRQRIRGFIAMVEESRLARLQRRRGPVKALKSRVGQSVEKSLPSRKIAGSVRVSRPESRRRVRPRP